MPWWSKKSSQSRSGPEAQPSLAQKHGLFLVSSTTEPWNDETAMYDLDIVFVHGLGGHFKKTWTHGEEESAFYWPKQCLAESLPGARVFSYSYPSGGLQLSRYEAGIRDFANGLLEGLRSKRQHESAYARPLIFISHSLGGIVVKQAISLARSSHDYESLWLKTIGILFLGTPHRGSVLADNALLFALLANLALTASGMSTWKGKITTTTLELLQTDREQLSHITSDFLSCLRRRSDIKIVSFYETKRMVGLNQLVVNQESARLGTERESFLQLDADHREICRFSGLEDPNLELVKARILEMAAIRLRKTKSLSVSTSSVTASLEGAVTDCVPFLNTVDMSQYSDITKRMARGTLQWFHGNSLYLKWTATLRSCILWISGFAGSGKTTLTLYVKQCLLEGNRKDRIVATFLCNDQDEKQRNGLHILQSLLYQIVEQCRSLWRFVVKAKDKHGPSHFQRLDGLWQILEQIVSSQKRPKIILLLDAIDECDMNTRQSILERLCALSQKDMDVVFKIFVTSRFDARSTIGIRHDSLHVIDIQLDDYKTEIANDISIVIEEKLQKFVRLGKCQQDIQELIATAFIAKADKTFLWAKFALDYLEERRGLFRTTIQDIDSLMPQGLEDVYSKYLSTIPEDDIPIVARLLSYIIACDRALTIVELNIILNMDTVTYHSPVVLQEVVQIDRRLIINLLGSLIRIEDDKVYLVHQTLKDYLIAVRPSSSVQHKFMVDVTQMKSTLAANWIRYMSACLEMESHAGILTTSSSDSGQYTQQEALTETDPDLIYGMNIFEDLSTEAVECQLRNHYSSSFTLFDYAALHWQTDLDIGVAIEEKNHGLLWESAYNLYEQDDHSNHAWFRYLWHHRLPAESFPSSSDSLMKAAFAGHYSVVAQLLQHPDREKSSIHQAIYWAVRHDHELCADALMSHKSGSDLETLNELYPLVVAAEHGSIRCISLILRKAGSYLNIKTHLGKTALMLAAGHGQTMSVTLLLQQSSLDVNLSDNVGRTALHWAVYSESTQTVRRLIQDPRTQSHVQDRHGRTCLMEAAASGLLEITELLLSNSAATINYRDSNGRTALSYACSGGHLAVVKRLCKVPDIDMLCPDHHGRVAHSWAACQKNLKVLDFLVRKAANGIDVPDNDGWAPFAWTLGPPAIVANAMKLLETGRIDVNRRDHLYSRPLMNWVAGYGETRLLERLLDCQDLHKDAKDRQGRTPLMDAAVAGHTETVSLLINLSTMDINAKDSQGRTALALAAQNGRAKTVIALSQAAGVALECKDCNGETPLDLALRLQHRQVSVLLQRAIEGLALDL